MHNEHAVVVLDDYWVESVLHTSPSIAKNHVYSELVVRERPPQSSAR